MLYGISAKKQSGKDLFLKIWNALILTKDGEPLLDEEILKLKTDILCRGAEYCGVGTFEREYFAKPLKEICSIIFKCDISSFEDEAFKENELPKTWMSNFPGIKTYREALQYIGTNMFREMFHKNMWVICALSTYEENKNWFVTDVRFPNEKEAIEKLGGKVIRIDTNKVSVDEHLSETSLDDAEFDIRIINDFDFGNYTRKIYDIMLSERIFETKIK